ncbi:MAG: ABC-2 transporter permease [Staphylococcus equorum]|uniref:ABC-2 transporter permease n=1 Tax=Staphylococcus TaxID=1279 RepID=UPI0008530140|nr:ABC-2 transporter permease [Staphylococcus equorum]MDG0837014.1 ABC-2 transporter permease [Staphylococcus equorum]MDK9871607.1 ABC-2 transporter permease [Staphylococcus equorum]MDK9877822.1 ABC-2 transporter permease [Staphylococcus equorum]MDN5828528.1 ABC-2 transporter permease [Staphylococcus equorum]MDN6571370.1 ABC-2 transporter permease [Staphylococcus equorum]
MKGLTLSSYYSSKKSLFTYLIVGIVASILFTFMNPIMTCFLPMIFLISPVTDNIKHEKDSKWMYYVSTLPKGRSAYVNSYFSFYGVLILIGLIIGIIPLALITQNLNLTLVSILIGIGGAGSYAIMFPLTFKFGPENSNVILITTSFIVIALFFLVFFGFIMPNIASSGSIEDIANVTSNLLVVSTYALLGIILLVFSYISSIKIFNKQEL